MVSSHFVSLQLSFFWSSERDPDVAGGAKQLTINRDRFYICAGFGKRYGHDGACLQRYHLSGLSVCQRPYGTRTKIRSQHTVESVRASAALEMTEHDASRFFPSHFLHTLPD